MTSRTRRVLAVALAVVLVLGAASYGLWRSQRQVLVVVDPACPPFLSGTSNATEDFADVVTWAGRMYWSSEGSTRGGEQLGVVTCSLLADRGDSGWRVAPGPWPDGTATVLPRATSLRVPVEERGGRGLVARTAAGDRLYCVQDEASPPTC